MKNLCFIFFILFITSGFSQDYHHALGLQTNYGFYKYESSNSSLTATKRSGALIFGIVYKASLSIVSKGSNYLAISAYPFVGYSSTSLAGTAVGGELPILLEFYFGAIDAKNFYIGAGINTATINSSFGDMGPIIGPHIGTGRQFSIAKKFISLRIGYTYGLNNSNERPANMTNVKDQRSMVSLGLLYFIGQ